MADDPAARGRRYERGLRSALRRPVRAWCVSIRASDRRIESSAIVDPERMAARQRHRVLLYGELVRHLVKPVEIRWPGLIYDEAAARLGVDARAVIDWMDKGWLGSRRERVPGRRGLPTRYAWTRPGGMDVGLPQGRAAGWGCLWQGLWEKVPREFEQVVERVPRLRAEARPEITALPPEVTIVTPEVITPPPAISTAAPEVSGTLEHGREHFRGGWDWVCPGRVAADGVALGCGRVCKKLVAPLPVWSIDRAMGVSAEDALVADYDPRRSRFACGKCWNVQHTPSAPGSVDAAWNQLVSFVSGGLLYGREVERPGGWVRGDGGHAE